MSRLSRYVLKQVILVTVFSTVVLCVLILLVQSLRLVDLIVNRGVSLGYFFQLTILLTPRFLSIVVPIAVFAATLFSYNRLITDSEIVVMRSAGLSQWALARPGMLVATGCVILCFILNLWLVPLSYRNFRDLYVQTRSSVSAAFLREGQFTTIGDSITVYVRARTGTRELRGVLIQDDRNANESWTIMAEQGALVETEEGPRIVVVRGNQQQFKDGKLTMIEFDKYTLDVGLDAATAEDRWRQPQERYLPDLFNPGDSSSDVYYRGKLIAEGHNRIATSLLPLSYAIIGLSMLLSGTFSRRGQLRQLFIAIGFTGMVLVASLAFHNLAGKIPVFNYAMYLNAGLPIVIGLAIMIRSGRMRRRTAGPAVAV